MQWKPNPETLLTLLATASLYLARVNEQLLQILVRMELYRAKTQQYGLYFEHRLIQTRIYSHQLVEDWFEPIHDILVSNSTILIYRETYQTTSSNTTKHINILTKIYTKVKKKVFGQSRLVLLK